MGFGPGLFGFGLLGSGSGLGFKVLGLMARAFGFKAFLGDLSAAGYGGFGVGCWIPSGAEDRREAAAALVTRHPGPTKPQELYTLRHAVYPKA